MQFKKWLLQEHSRGTTGKQALYPPAYSLACFYPPADVITWSADAITYMSEKDRQFKFIWGKGMLADPSKE
jgi:hypothetical protein